jgi:hypothetical protein
VSDFRLLLMDYATGVISPYYTSMGLPSDLTLSDHSLYINVGGTAQLTANVFPPMTSGFYTWSSDDTSVATVDQNGVVTAVRTGMCAITCASSYNPELKDDCIITVKQMVTSITLNHQLCNLNKNDVLQLQATVLPADADQSVTWTSSDEYVVAVSSDGQVYAKNYGSCTVTCTANDGSDVSATCYIYVTGSVRSSVDLGLPSGTLWAISNVGASSSAAYGDYFAWGETQPKEVYDWSTYIYSNGAVDQLTKYCNNSDFGYNGFTDNLTILQPGDDAATANYGGRTPTKEEWQELLDNTTATWTTQNGVNGELFTGTNGNSLFLPAASYRWGSTFYHGGSHGGYWSSSLSITITWSARLFFFDPSNQRVDGSSRYYGYTVRAVRSAE